MVTSYMLLLHLATCLLAARVISQETTDGEWMYDPADTSVETDNNDDGDDVDYVDSKGYEEQSGLQNVYINQHRYSYIINNENVCDRGVFLLALIKTAPGRFMERQAIRNTWGSVKTHNGVNIVSVFIMGRYDIKKDTSHMEEELMKENAEFGDIVQGDFIEHARNQTYTSVMGLAWTHSYCGKAHFILTTNDNTMVDVFHAVDFLKKQQQVKADDFLHCSTFFDICPVRNPADALYVTVNEYPYETYPPHCEAFANIVSNKTLTKLLQTSKWTPAFWLDNVYVTGMLAADADVKHMDMSEEHGYNLMQTEHIANDIEQSMFLLATCSSLRKNWDNAWKAIQSLQ